MKSVAAGRYNYIVTNSCMILVRQIQAKPKRAMLVMIEFIQQRIVENGKRSIATWFYIDKFHVLLNHGAKYL